VEQARSNALQEVILAERTRDQGLQGTLEEQVARATASRDCASQNEVGTKPLRHIMGLILGTE
jgi:hypothetical protein